MFDCYIFDCDGVLFDSIQANIEFYNTLLSSFNKPLMNDSQIQYIHTATAEDSVAYLFKGDHRLSEAQRLRLATDYNRFIPYMKLAPGAKKTLQVLKNMGKRIAIFTNRSTSMKAILKYFNLTFLFDYVVTALDVAKPKPDPEGLFLILKVFELHPEETLFIGDSTLDQQASQSAGIPFAAFQCPELDADYYIDNFEQILTIHPHKKGIYHADNHRN